MPISSSINSHHLVRSITLDRASMSIQVGANPQPITATAWTGPNGNGIALDTESRAVVWILSDPSLASVEPAIGATADVTAIDEGSCTIKASLGNGSVESVAIDVTCIPGANLGLAPDGQEGTAQLGSPVLARTLYPTGLELAIDIGLAAAVRQMALALPELTAEVGAVAMIDPVSTGPTFYVSPTGIDSADGATPATAWRTINKVNTTNFAAGSIIAFEGGQNFAGTLALDTSDGGTAANPITITSYGTGRATITGGTGAAITVTNRGAVIVKDLILVGTGNNNTHGLNVFNNLAGDVMLDLVIVDNVEVSGFGQYGFSIGAFAGRSGWRNVTIKNSSTHDNKLAGINVWAFTGQLNVHQNITVRDTVAFNNPGKAGTNNNSGSGIVFGSVDGGLVEYCRAFNNGTLNTASAGPIGIWAYNGNNVTFQFNESYSNHTSGANDGGGFDFGQFQTNSLMQYNYSHNNDGAGFLLDGYSAKDNVGNVIRYNISENDNRTRSFGAITVFGLVRNAEIYNNTVYINPASATQTRAFYAFNAGGTLAATNLKVRNNLFYTVGTARLVEVLQAYLTVSTIRFEGNSYHGATSFAVQYGSTSYATLAAWRTATTQEVLSGNNVGISGNPLLTNPGAGGTIGNARNLATLTAYKIQAGSPCINAGLDLPTLFGLNVGTVDFYGNPIPSGAYDIGAHEL